MEDEIFVKQQDVENLAKYLPGVYANFDELTMKIGEILVKIVKEREKVEEYLS
jgi:hypothetical protein